MRAPGPETGEYFGYAVYERSNDDILDKAIIFELKNIVRALQINPGFKYIKEENAFATADTIVEGTKGTVMLGLALIGKLMREPDGGISVAGICAHECAHIHQFETGIFDKLKDRIQGIAQTELHADFIAGYYIGKRNGATNDALVKFTNTIFKFGTYSDAPHIAHGTPGQRAASVEKGFRVAKDNVALKEASEIGVSYVSNL